MRTAFSTILLFAHLNLTLCGNYFDVIAVKNYMLGGMLTAPKRMQSCHNDVLQFAAMCASSLTAESICQHVISSAM